MQGGRPVVLWAATTAPTRTAPTPAQDGVSLPWLEPGALLGLLHLPLGARDARGDAVPSGHYTLRYAVQPRLKDHVEVSAHRDFALLVPAARDRGAPLDEAEVMALSRPAPSRHPHVLALSAGEPCPRGAVALRLAARRACLLLNE